jgi:hypothetical protein
LIALRRAHRGSAGVSQFCELDRWSFDPRYTDGRCPICGWQPEGAPKAPAWLTLGRRVEWELVGLVALLVVLVVLGVVVARAAGIAVPLPLTHQAGVPPAASTASPATGTAPPSGSLTTRVHGGKSAVH